MKYTCLRKCQYRNNSGKIRVAEVGEVVRFKEAPLKEHWQALKDMEIDFAEMSEEELSAAEYDLGDLKAFIQDKYDMKAGNKGKAKTIEMLMDCRFRELS